MIPEDAEKKLENFGRKRIVVGIPSYNNSETIKKVAEVSARAILDHFGGDGVIVNSDGGSRDGTREAFMASETNGVEKLSFVYEGIPGKGSALMAIFKVAQILDSDVVVLLDSDLRSVEPWWVERLSKPILEGGFDYVAPFYIRHKYDATITNHICYPMTSILYGKKIRQPIGGDFGVGRKLYRIYLERWKDFSEGNAARFGIDIWMTTIALNESGKVAQAFLGAKVHDVKDPGKHLGPMFEQVVSTLFELMIMYQERWKLIDKIEETPIFGEPVEVELEEIEIDLENLKRKAREGVEDLEFIDRSLVYKVRDGGKLEAEDWIEIVFSFSLEYKKSRDPSIVSKMIPFYYARVANFIEETLDLDSREAEKVVDEQLEKFKERKVDLVKRWFS